MRRLPYVRFLDEEGWTPSEEGKDWESLRKRLESDPFWKEVERRQRPEHTAVLESAGVRWTGVDNHTHSLTIGALKSAGNSSADKLLLDFLILEELGDRTIELITNSFTQPLLASEESVWAQGKLTHNLNYQEYP